MSMCTWSLSGKEKTLGGKHNAESAVQCVDGTVDAETIRKNVRKCQNDNHFHASTVA